MTEYHFFDRIVFEDFRPTVEARSVFSSFIPPKNTVLTATGTALSHPHHFGRRADILFPNGYCLRVVQDPNGIVKSGLTIEARHALFDVSIGRVDTQTVWQPLLDPDMIQNLCERFKIDYKSKFVPTIDEAGSPFHGGGMLRNVTAYEIDQLMQSIHDMGDRAYNFTAAGMAATIRAYEKVSRKKIQIIFKLDLTL